MTTKPPKDPEVKKAPAKRKPRTVGKSLADLKKLSGNPSWSWGDAGPKVETTKEIPEVPELPRIGKRSVTRKPRKVVTIPDLSEELVVAQEAPVITPEVVVVAQEAPVITPEVVVVAQEAPVVAPEVSDDDLKVKRFINQILSLKEIGVTTISGFRLVTGGKRSVYKKPFRGGILVIGAQVDEDFFIHAEIPVAREKLPVRWNPLLEAWDIV